jgi:hypothetical protein
MNWKTLIALLLFSLIGWLNGLTPFSTALELAEHYVLFPEGSHSNEICVHPSSPVDPPHESATFDIPDDESVPHEQLIALLPHPHTGRDRPPPLFYSLSHSLRAPPSLILA